MEQQNTVKSKIIELELKKLDEPKAYIPKSDPKASESIVKKLRKTDLLSWKDRLTNDFPKTYENIQSLNICLEETDCEAIYHDECHQRFVSSKLEPTDQELFFAIINNDIEKIKNFIENKGINDLYFAFCFKKDGKKCNALQHAATLGRKEIQELVFNQILSLRNKKDITWTDDKGCNLIHWMIMCQSEHKETRIKLNEAIKQNKDVQNTENKLGYLDLMVLYGVKPLYFQYDDNETTLQINHYQQQIEKAREEISSRSLTESKLNEKEIEQLIARQERLLKEIQERSDLIENYQKKLLSLGKEANNAEIKKLILQQITELEKEMRESEESVKKIQVEITTLQTPHLRVRKLKDEIFKLQNSAKKALEEMEEINKNQNLLQDESIALQETQKESLKKSKIQTIQKLNEAIKIKEEELNKAEQDALFSAYKGTINSAEENIKKLQKTLEKQKKESKEAKIKFVSDAKRQQQFTFLANTTGNFSHACQLNEKLPLEEIKIFDMAESEDFVGIRKLLELKPQAIDQLDEDLLAFFENKNMRVFVIHDMFKSRKKSNTFAEFSEFESNLAKTTKLNAMLPKKGLFGSPQKTTISFTKLEIYAKLGFLDEVECAIQCFTNQENQAQSFSKQHPGLVVHLLQFGLDKFAAKLLNNFKIRSMLSDSQLNYRDYLGFSSLDYAIKNKNWQLVELLIQAGARLSESNEKDLQTEKQDTLIHFHDLFCIVKGIPKDNPSDQTIISLLNFLEENPFYGSLIKNLKKETSLEEKIKSIFTSMAMNFVILKSEHFATVLFIFRFILQNDVQFNTFEINNLLKTLEKTYTDKELLEVATLIHTIWNGMTVIVPQAQEEGKTPAEHTVSIQCRLEDIEKLAKYIGSLDFTTITKINDKFKETAAMIIKGKNWNAMALLLSKGFKFNLQKQSDPNETIEEIKKAIKDSEKSKALLGDMKIYNKDFYDTICPNNDESFFIVVKTTDPDNNNHNMEELPQEQEQTIPPVIEIPQIVISKEPEVKPEETTNSKEENKLEITPTTIVETTTSMTTSQSEEIVLEKNSKETTPSIVTPEETKEIIAPTATTPESPEKLGKMEEKESNNNHTMATPLVLFSPKKLEPPTLTVSIFSLKLDSFKQMKKENDLKEIDKKELDISLLITLLNLPKPKEQSILEKNLKTIMEKMYASFNPIELQKKSKEDRYKEMNKVDHDKGFSTLLEFVKFNSNNPELTDELFSKIKVILLEYFFEKANVNKILLAKQTLYLTKVIENLNPEQISKFDNLIISILKKIEEKTSYDILTLLVDSKNREKFQKAKNLQLDPTVKDNSETKTPNGPK